MSLPSPSGIARRLRRGVAFVALMSAVSCALVGATETAASASLLGSLLPSCAPVPTTMPFAPWGDSHSYFLMPDGGFESGAPGWTRVAGPTVVSGNETSFVNARTDSHSLAMPTGGVVVSPTQCVAMGENTIRLFVKNSGVASSVLHIQAFVQNPLTGLVLSTGFNIKGTAGATAWAPSNQLFIPNLLGGVLGTQRLTLVFSTTGAPATWNIDDVYVDPFKVR
jgi:hypothetical protein